MRTLTVDELNEVQGAFSNQNLMIGGGVLLASCLPVFKVNKSQVVVTPFIDMNGMPMERVDTYEWAERRSLLGMLSPF